MIVNQLIICGNSNIRQFDITLNLKKFLNKHPSKTVGLITLFLDINGAYSIQNEMIPINQVLISPMNEISNFNAFKTPLLNINDKSWVLYELLKEMKSELLVIDNDPFKYDRLKVLVKEKILINNLSEIKFNKKSFCCNGFFK